LDATFFDGNELPGRDLSKIPHPLVQDSLQRFGRLPTAEKNKIHFLHFNHTNPLLDESSRAAREVQAAGFHLAKQLQVFGL
jgi:pyrroloquinoline quinone biosynthesis protein B